MSILITVGCIEIVAAVAFLVWSETRPERRAYNKAISEVGNV